MTARLPWKINPAGGFIAYPDGESRTACRAEIEYDLTLSTGKWRWRAIYDDALMAGRGETRQEAADGATDAWPKVKVLAAEIAAKGAAEAALRTLVIRQVKGQTVPLSMFGIEDSTSDRLRRIIWLVRDQVRPTAMEITGPAKPLLDAISAELYRRRTEGA